MSLGNNNIIYFPPQKKSTKSKTKEWYKDCVDSAETLALFRDNRIRESKHNMRVNYDLYNDIIDEAEIERVFNPLGLENAVFPASIKNYPLSIPKIDLLQGEEIKRRFDWAVRSKNEDAVSNKQNKLKDMLMQIVQEEIVNEEFDQEAVEKRIRDLGKYFNYEFKDLQELTATRILQYLWNKEDLKSKFNEGYVDALIAGEELYRIDIVANEPKLSKCSPLNIFTIRSGESHMIEDSDIIVEVKYEPVGKVIDEFYDYLSSDEISRIESGYYKHHEGDSNLGYINVNPRIFYPDFEDSNRLIDVADHSEVYYDSVYSGPYDNEGNVRVVRVRWRGRRKIGRLTFFDDNGDKQERIVSEYYKPDKAAGETVKWLWVNEAYEGTKIAYDIYVKMQQRPVQFRTLNNHSKCDLGYVGTYYATNTSKVRSLMDRMKPYQYLYNVYMRRLELVYARYGGPIMEIDVSKIPDDWEMDKWMYYMQVLGYMITDPFNEGKKGAAMGKLAGNFNTTGKMLNPDVGNFIQQTIMMLQYIENQIGKIAGVTEQREGQISNRETVGGVERAVTQSSHITERWFFVHDNTKKRVMMALLDTAKQAWKGRNIKLDFVLDDMSRAFLDMHGDDITSTEFDLFVTNSSEDMELRQTIKAITQAYMQNGGSMSTVIDVLRSDSITAMARKLEGDELRIREEAQQAEQANRETQERIAQMAEQSKQADRDLKKYEIDTKANTDIQKELIKNSGVEDNTLDAEKLELQRRKQEADESFKQADLDFKEKQLDEVSRHNKITEQISKNKPSGSTK